MKLFRRWSVIAALVLGLSVVTSAFTYVQVHSLAVGSDTYKFILYTGANGTGTNIGVTTYTGANVATVTGYYDGGCICYHVPLSILNYQPGYGVGDVGSVKVQHFSIYLPHGNESMIEILDELARLARERAPYFGARPWHLFKMFWVGIFDGKHIAGSGGGSTDK